MKKITDWIKRHQIVAFFIITFAITWGIGAFAILLPTQFKNLLGELSETHPFYYIAVAAPTISATILALALGGLSGLGTLYRRLI